MVLPWCRALVGVALNVSLGYVEKKAAEDGKRHSFCQQGGSVPGIRGSARGLLTPAKPLHSTCVTPWLFSVRLLWRLMQRVFTSLSLGKCVLFCVIPINKDMCIQYIGSDKSSTCANSA